MSDNASQFEDVSDCPKEQEFECHVCDEPFYYPEYLEPLEAYREHLESEHSLRGTHKALVEDGGTICAGCGQLFVTDDAYDAHDCPETHVSKPKKAATKAKAGGKKATDVTKQEIYDLFNDFGPADLVAIVVGFGVGNMVGHDFEQAITIALAVGSGGVLDAARKKKQSKFDPIHLKFVRQRAEWFILGFGMGAFYIFAFHGSEINAPDAWYQILEQLWNTYDTLGGGAS